MRLLIVGARWAGLSISKTSDPLGFSCKLCGQRRMTRLVWANRKVKVTQITIRYKVFLSPTNIPMGSLSFLRSEIRRERDRERRSVVVPEWAVVHSEVSCSDWLLVSLAALWDLNIFLQKSFLPKSAPGICSSLIHKHRSTQTQSMQISDICINKYLELVKLI